MSKVLTDPANYTAIANAIRSKGVNGVFKPSEMANAINGISTGITPTGKLNITDTAVKDVTNYAQAQIVDANLKAENIKKDVTVLGITGTHEGGGGGGFTPGPFNVALDLRSVRVGVSVLSITGSNVVPTWGSMPYRTSNYWEAPSSWRSEVISASLNVLRIDTSSQLMGSFSTNPLNSAIYVGSTNFGSQEFVFLADCTLTVISSCLLPDTLITLADGTRKAIKDITYQDELKLWDFDKGEFSTASICWLTRSGLHNDHIYRLTFSDGAVVDFTGHKSNHKVYNVDTRKFEGVNVTEIGDRIFSENGIVTVVDKEYIEQDVEYYNLITTGKINCFANGILSSDRYGNMYPIDEQMKYIKGDRPIRPYSEFEPHQIKKYWYDHLRLGELTEDINDTVDYIGKLECQMNDINHNL